MSTKNKEMQQGRIMPREEFQLTSFKLKEQGRKGVVISHHISGLDSGDVTVNRDTVPHPDLIEALETLKLYMASRIGVLEGWDFSREKLKKNPNYLKLAKEGHDACVERCNVNGITYKGEGETLGVCITGSFQTPEGASFGLSVPKISFAKEELGYEEDVKDLCEKVTDEVYNYLILRKKSQTNVEDQAEGYDNDGEYVNPAQGVLDMTPDANGFDENGERDFAPSPEQLGEDVKSDEEE